MERSDLLDAMGKLKLYGMRAAYDEILTTAVKRQHEPQQIIGDLLAAEISEKQARSIKYQMTIAKLPLAKELEEFDFEATEVNETLIRDLATGDFLDHRKRPAWPLFPGQEVLDAVDLVIWDAGDGVGEPCLGINAVEFGGFDQCVCDSCGAPAGG